MVSLSNKVDEICCRIGNLDLLLLHPPREAGSTTEEKVREETVLSGLGRAGGMGRYRLKGLLFRSKGILPSESKEGKC